MIKEVMYCDMCGKEIKEKIDLNNCEIVFTVGWSPDPAGGRSEEDHEYRHLCYVHLLKFANDLLQNMSHEEQQKLVDKIKLK